MPEQITRFGVWTELMKPKDIISSIPYLGKYDFAIAVAFPYETIDEEYKYLLDRLCSEKIITYLWVLMPDDLGYWAHEGNANQFFEKVDSLMDQAKKNDLHMNIAVDMEIPLDQMRLFENGKILRLIGALAGNINRIKFRKAQATFDCLAEEIRKKGGRTISPIPFNLTHELINEKDMIQDILQTPIAEWDKISPMFYTSLFEKLTKGIFRKEDARWYMYRTMKEFRKARGSQAGVSLGTTGPGKLGNDGVYDNPDDFIPDVQAAIAAGAEDVFIFNLDGIMSSPDPESWFRKIRNAEGKIPKKTLKGEALYHLSSFLGKI